MVGLQISQNEDARDGARELPKALVDVLRLKRHALLELLAVDLGTRAHPRALLPGPRSVGVERSPWAELPLGEGLNSRLHVGVGGRAVTFEDSLKTRGVRQRPALVGVVAEAQSRHLGLTAGPEHGVAVDAVKHPASQ